MKMGWQPTHDGLEQILTLLRQSQSTDSQTQSHVQKNLEELNKYSDFNNYLVFVLTKLNNEGLIILSSFLKFFNLVFLMQTNICDP